MLVLPITEQAKKARMGQNN